MEAKELEKAALGTVFNGESILLSGVDFNKPACIWMEELLKAQALHTYPIGFEAGKKEAIDKIYKWFTTECPHANVEKKYCAYCLHDLLESLKQGKFPEEE